MTMRDDVRTAFERQQYSLGEVGDARHRLMHGAMVNREAPASRNLQWAAGIAAVLIAAIVITTFALVKAGSHVSTVPAATPSPMTQASPTPLSNPLTVPNSTPILTYTDPADSFQTDGITWDGSTAGRLDGNVVGTPNPAGNLFGTSNLIIDRSGSDVAQGTYGAKGWQARWADDERHFCYVSPFSTPDSAPTTLYVSTPGGTSRLVARIGTLYNQTSVRVAACSELADRAVVVQSGGQGVGTSQYWVVQLSTGRVLWTRRYDVNQTDVQVIVSRDGMYVAEDSMQAASPAGVTVYGPDGKALQHLDSWVEGFSWDGTLAVADMGYGKGPVQLVRWRDASVVWSAPPGFTQLTGALPQPGGGDLALYIAEPQTDTPGSVFVINSAGNLLFRIDHAVYPACTCP